MIYVDKEYVYLKVLKEISKNFVLICFYLKKRNEIYSLE